jgi:GT2 family glycosyltransferase
MTIGIVVPTLNRIRKLKRFVNCLSRQTYKDFHVYIIDSGSTDGTREEAFSFPVPCSFITATSDDWWTSATNIGIKKALDDGCEYVLTINDDAIILDNYLENFMELFTKHNLKFCANRIDFADKPGMVWALGSYSTFGSPFLFQLKYNEYWYDELPQDILSREIIPTMTVCGDGVLIHKSVFEKIGFYNEKFTPHVHADSEFSLRANKNGIPVYVAPNIVLYNDTENLSEEETPTVDNRNFFQKIKDVFFNKKSDCYWRPVFHITIKYAGKKFIFPTLIRFFIWKFFVFFYTDFSKFFQPPQVSTTTNRKFLISKTQNIVKSVLRRTAFWVFDLKKYDEETTKHLIYDKNQQNFIEKIKTMIQYY